MRSRGLQLLKGRIMAKRFYAPDRGGKPLEVREEQERADGSMIREDWNCMSGLPYNVIIKEYPKVMSMMEMADNDDLNSIDRQIDQYDGAAIRRARAPKRV